MDIAQANIATDMQGRSLVPLLLGATPTNWRKGLCCHYYEYFANRRAAHMVRRHYGVRTARYKLIHFYNLHEWELFDLQSDPREMRSIYQDPQFAAVVKELKAEIVRLQKRYKVPDDRGSVPKQGTTVLKKDAR